MRSRRVRTLLLGFVGLLGCQNPPDISGDVENYANIVNDVRFTQCTCFQTLGFATAEECDNTLGRVDANDQACAESVLEGHEEAARDYLVCAADAFDDYDICLQGNVNCEGSVADDCAQTQMVALAACPQLPAEVRVDFAACVE